MQNPSSARASGPQRNCARPEGRRCGAGSVPSPSLRGTRGNSCQSPHPTLTGLAAARPEAKCPQGRAGVPLPVLRGEARPVSLGNQQARCGRPKPRSFLRTRKHHPQQVRTKRNWGASHPQPEPPWRGSSVPPSPGLVVEKGPHPLVPIPLPRGPGQSWTWGRHLPQPPAPGSGHLPVITAAPQVTERCRRVSPRWRGGRLFPGLRAVFPGAHSPPAEAQPYTVS